MPGIKGKMEVVLFRHLDGRLTHGERMSLLEELASVVDPTLVSREQGAREFAEELNRARRVFEPMASAHEGYAIILEELDELKAIVWQKQSKRDYAAMRKEVIQLGAMTLAFLTEVVETENRR